MRKTVLRWIVLCMVLAASTTMFAAQGETGNDLRIVFVSNRLGNEEIYVMTQAGESGPVTNLTNNPARDWNPAWSPQGDRLIFNSDRDGRDTLYIMDADGTNVRPLFPGETFQDYDAAWSPDGSKIVFISNRATLGREIFIANSDGSDVQPFTDDGKLKGDPVWSPDGEEIVYWEVQNETGEIFLFRRPIDSDTIQLIASDGPANGSAVWVEDTIYFDSNRRDEMWYIFSMEPDGARPRRISTEDVNSGRVSPSPDGSRLAFVTDRDDNDEIYIMNADGSGLARLTNNRFSDHSPAWQPAVPENQPFVGTQAAVEPTPDAASNDLLSIAVGQSANGILAYPISIERLLIEYGIAAWHDAGWTGAGQRVGVIDLTFGGLAAFNDHVRPVELPVLPGHDLAAYNVDNDEHGTKVLRVIHAVAPNADLFACRYDGQLNNLQDCVEWMQSRDVRIINHSVGLPVLPDNGQNEWASLVNDTFARGILWVNSSGNFDQGYWEDNWDDRDGDNYQNFFIGAREWDGLPVNIEGSYNGSVLLSWDEANVLVYNEEGIRERVNLDLEIVGLATGEIIGASDRQQNVQLNAPAVERVPLDTDQPFMIRVKNAGGELTQNIRLKIFIEFTPLELVTGPSSIVAPADAVSSFTIGSVNGNREAAPYSSRGVVNDYAKPEIAAPGEIILIDEEDPFVGTSAAAPVVSGIAALLMEEDPTLGTDRVQNRIQSVWIERRDSIPYGDGIVQLGPPPSSRIGDVVVDTPPRTVFPVPEEIEENRRVSCATRLPTRFEIGVPGYVNYDLRLRMRAEPSTEGVEIAQLLYGEPFEVIGGPVCASGMYWWLIEIGTGAEGWVGEGFDYYLIAPTSLERARYPVTFDTVCPSAPDSLLQIGDQARMLRGGLFFFRGLGTRAERGEMDPLPADTTLEILGGPVCEGDANNILRWYVRVMDGPRAGYEGWAQEGITDERTMAPISQRIQQDAPGE